MPTRDGNDDRRAWQRLAVEGLPTLAEMQRHREIEREQHNERGERRIAPEKEATSRRDALPIDRGHVNFMARFPLAASASPWPSPAMIAPALASTAACEKGLRPCARQPARTPCQHPSVISSSSEGDHEDSGSTWSASSRIRA